MNKRFLLLVLLLILPMALLVGSKFSQSVHPGFFYEEIFGMSYPGGIGIKELCNDDLLAGIEKLGPLVSGHRTSSIVFLFPEKLLRKHFDVFTIHRAVMAILYASGLLFLAALGSLLRLRIPLLIYLITSVAMGNHLLSYLYGFRLTITLFPWITLLLIHFAVLMNRLNARKIDRTTMLLIGCMPFLAIFSFEIYCIARPLGLIYLVYALLLIWLSNYFIDIKAVATTILATSTLASVSLLKLIHPLTKLDQSLLSGNYEGIIKNDGQLTAGPLDHVAARIKELTGLFSLEATQGISSPQFGSLEIICLSAFLVATTAILVKREKTKTTLLPQIKADLPILVLLLLLTAGAVVTPLASTAYVRVHRLGAFYLTLSLFNVILLNNLVLIFHGKLQRIIYGSAIVISLLILGFRVPAILKWQSDPAYTPHYYHDLLHELRELDIPPNRLGNRSHQVLDICDLDPQDPSILNWITAAHVSGLSCRLDALIIRSSCDCLEDSGARHPSSVICLIRKIENDRNSLELRHYDQGTP